MSRARTMLMLAIAFAVWGLVDVRVRGTLDPHNAGIHKTDFTVYTEAGAAFFDGRDPYTVTNVRGWGYLYLPLFAMLLAPLHALNPQIQVLIWFALSSVMAWGSYVELVRIARAVLPGEAEGGIFGPIPPWIGYAAIGAAALPALNCLQRGQVGVAKIYLLLLAFRLFVESCSAARLFVAGIVFSLPIVLKITPAIPVAFVLVQQWVAARSAKSTSAAPQGATACSLGVGFGLVFCILILPACLVGWQSNLDHLGTWWQRVAMRAEITLGDDFAGDSSSVRNQSLTNSVHRFGNWASYWFAGGADDEGPQQLREGGEGLLMDAPQVEWALRMARLAAAGLLLAVGYRTGRSPDLLARAAGFGLACASTLIIIPIARGHYYVLLLPAVAFLPTWLVRQRRPRLAAFYAAVPCVLLLVHYTLLNYAGRIGLLGLGTTAWYVAASLTLIRLSRPSLAGAEKAIEIGPAAGTPQSIAA